MHCNVVLQKNGDGKDFSPATGFSIRGHSPSCLRHLSSHMGVSTSKDSYTVESTYMVLMHCNFVLQKNGDGKDFSPTPGFSIRGHSPSCLRHLSSHSGLPAFLLSST
jgi:hypothetical protein